MIKNTEWKELIVVDEKEGWQRTTQDLKSLVVANALYYVIVHRPVGWDKGSVLQCITERPM